MIGLISMIAALVGLGVAVFIYRDMVSRPAGVEKVSAIAKKIRQGARVFIREEYKYMIIFSVVVSILLLYLVSVGTFISFWVGATTSAGAGLIGMSAATRANVRTTVAAEDRGLNEALKVAFDGGSIMGLTVASLGLLGLGLLYMLYGGDPETVHAIHGFGVGASSVALFARVGGGIYTKSADVGADLVGKLEEGIPEDDPRNPGVIADAVGDNVGDVAGMGSDIYESYCGSIIATIAIATSVANAPEIFSTLPLILAVLGIGCSITAILAFRILQSMDPALAMRYVLLGGGAMFIVLSFPLIIYSIAEVEGLSTTAIELWICVAVGSLVGILIGLVTEYFTAKKPVYDIIEQAATGPATVIISGFATGMKSAVIPVIAIAVVILISANLVGLYGVALSAVGMLATVGITMAVDAYGPVADNAGGIAEMAGLDSKVRETTDQLDAVGNTTAAIGKGFAIGAAALAALAIIAAYVQTVTANTEDFTLRITDPNVLAGMLVGASIPFLIAAITMQAVGDAASSMIAEIRRQFNTIEGLREGTAEPDTDECVEIATKAAVKSMAIPAGIAVLLPILVGLILGPTVLGGFLAGALLSAVLLALTMANAGGAWDNAKKYIEAEKDGKGSDRHSAAVVGDTVGDPFKDTSGPSMNILINVMAIVSLTIAPIL